MYADSIKNRFVGGESVEDLARYYGMTVLEIENLIRFSLQTPPEVRKKTPYSTPNGNY